MKQNFMGAYQQQFAPNAGNNNTNNQYAFPGYNATMEDALSPISPALAFEGDQESLLLPGKGGVAAAAHPPKQQRRRHDEYSSQVSALAGTYNENVPANAYGISSGNPTNFEAAATVVNNSSVYPMPLNKPQAMEISSQAAVPQMPHDLNQAVVATQQQFAQSIPSSKPSAATAIANPNPVVSSAPNAVGIFPQQQPQAVGGPAPPAIHPTAAAALVSGVGANNLPFFFPHHLTAAYLMQKAESAEETEEKRAKRLERNRESARKSRRRKKERLQHLEGKVNKLYGKIEKERRVQINAIDTAWKTFDMEDLRELKEFQVSSPNNTNDMDREERLRRGLSRLLIGEKEQSVSKEIVEFQYSSLVQHLLPRYQKYFLWMILQQKSYFLAGKEGHSKREFTKKIATGKISSKQLGEEISNGPKHTPPSNQDLSQGSQFARVSDAERFWPLVCFELSISVEQEERFLEAQGRYVVLFRGYVVLHRFMCRLF
jgi:hypothetical protein